MNYNIHEQIGEGGLAIVNRATDENGRELAIKMLKESVDEDKQRARFRQEIRIQATLEHPGILKVIAANLNADNPFYIMPLAQCNLGKLIPHYSTNHPLFESVATDLIEALEYAHGQRVHHRDLKPRNILIYNEKPVIADFGLGKAIDIEASYTTTTSDAWGTWWYAPPEQQKGLNHCDERSDIYSLGKLFLECLAGTRVNEIPDSMDYKWHYIIRKAIRDDPAKRWQSVSDMRRQFELVFQIKDPLVVDPEDIMGFLGTVAAQHGPASSGQVEQFRTYINNLLDDEILLRKVFDKLPPNLVEAWSTEDPDGFARFVKHYDDSLGDVLSFNYCDVIADQYSMIHSVIQDTELRDFLRKRLYRLGPDNNRWHVGETLGKMLCNVRDPADIAQVIELIERHPELAKWNSSYIQDARIDKRIRDCIKLPEMEDSNQ